MDARSEVKMTVGGPESRDGEHLRCDNELRGCNNDYHQFMNSQKYKIRILLMYAIDLCLRYRF